MVYTKLEQMDDNLYSIYFTDKFYTIFRPYYKDGSYFNILYRLFNLLPQDYYHMIGKEYNAIFKPSSVLKNHIYIRFKKEDGIKLCAEIDRRLQYCIDREDFN